MRGFGPRPGWSWPKAIRALDATPQRETARPHPSFSAGSDSFTSYDSGIDSSHKPPQRNSAYVPTTLPKYLADRIFDAATDADIDDWLADAAKQAGGLRWKPLGGIDNNPHTVEVASDPALALVEIPVNGIDALLDLAARERNEGAPTPHRAAQRWYGIPAGGLSEMSDVERREQAKLLRLTVRESQDSKRPTIEVQEQGTGQHPEDWGETLLSLLASNKKTKGHQMGVYNAGGAASCRFARSKVIVSRLAPSLLAGRDDQVGVTVIRYNPLDPDQFKTGSYEYAVDRNGDILLLDLDQLPEMPHGTYVKLIEYELSRYAGAAHLPQRSLWHLLHAALPQPPLPMQIIETRDERFAGVRGVERRTVSGLLHLLGRKGTADYHDARQIDLGPDVGVVTLRYYVLNDGVEPDTYVTTDQGLTITLNGQRQVTKNRAWIKRKLELPFLFRRLIVVVDGTTLTNAAKREIFSSTRETGADTPTTRRVLDRVVGELVGDENLRAYDEEQKRRALEAATRSTTSKVKQQLAHQIGAYLRGDLAGQKGGAGNPKPSPRPPRPPSPPDTDDSLLHEIPDTLRIISDPMRIEPGRTAALRLEINAKNNFFPQHEDALAVVVGPDLASHIKVRAKGKLLGGRARVTLEADQDCPEGTSTVRVALTSPALGVLLTAEADLIVAARVNPPDSESPHGGEPDIDVTWTGRNGWGEFSPPWDAETVGICEIKHEDPDNPTAITKAEWIMNEDFAPYAQVVRSKNMGEAKLNAFREGYEFPVLFALFRQRLADTAKEQEADDAGEANGVSDDYLRGEQARMARAVLMAMEPSLTVLVAADAE